MLVQDWHCGAGPFLTGSDHDFSKPPDPGPVLTKYLSVPQKNLLLVSFDNENRLK